MVANKLLTSLAWVKSLNHPLTGLFKISLIPKLREPMKSFLEVLSQSQTSTDNLLTLSSVLRILKQILGNIKPSAGENFHSSETNMFTLMGATLKGKRISLTFSCSHSKLDSVNLLLFLFSSSEFPNCSLESI